MDKEKVMQQLQDERDENQAKMDSYMDNLHDALLGIGTHSVKDMRAAVIQCQNEARKIQVCLVALKR